MKKLLLVSAIVCGSVSFASAQAADQMVPAQSKQTAATPVKKQKADADANKLASARPSLMKNTVPAQKAATRKTAIRKTPVKAN